MKVSLLICTYNRYSLLDRTLESVGEMIVPGDVDLEIIVVDNNSTDETKRVVDEHAHHLPIRRISEPRQGLSFARNTAVAAAVGELVVWTDDDVIVGRDWLSSYVEAARLWPDAAYFGGAIEPAFERPSPGWVAKHLAHLTGPFSLLGFDGPSRLMTPGEYPIGANMAFRAEILGRYPFDGRLGRAGESLLAGEDSDLFVRLASDGHAGAWAVGATVRHHIGRERQSIRHLCR